MFCKACLIQEFSVLFKDFIEGKEDMGKENEILIKLKYIYCLIS